MAKVRPGTTAISAAPLPRRCYCHVESFQGQQCVHSWEGDQRSCGLRTSSRLSTQRRSWFSTRGSRSPMPRDLVTGALTTARLEETHLIALLGNNYDASLGG